MSQDCQSQYPMPLYIFSKQALNSIFCHLTTQSKYVIKRLKNAEAILTPENLNKMKTVGDRFKGKDYDIYFEWSDDKIYCSELVWKIYKEALDIEIGNLETLKDFNLKDPIVKEKLHERYGDKIPLNELVISPAAMFESDKLIIVLKN